MNSPWPILPFDSVFEDCSGGNAKTLQSDYKAAGKFAVIDQGKDLVAGYVDDPALLCHVALPAIVFGDHTRIFKFVNFPFCMGADGTKVLRPRLRADEKFLYYYLRSLDIPAAGYSRHFRILKRMKIALPSLEEQRRIAAILDKADALRQKRRSALQKLDSLTQSLFLDMFGDSLNTGHADIKPLGEVCTRITDGTHQPPQWSPTGIPFLFVSNIRDGNIDFCTQKFISEATYSELTRNCPIEEGDVLYTTVGSYGNSAVVQDSRKFAFQRHIAHIKPQRRMIEPAFLAIMLESALVRHQADRLARGIAQKTINLAEIRSFNVLVPDIKLQREFVQRTRDISKIRRPVSASGERLDATFHTLQHRAFRGAL